ncbi:MAG: transcriptional repressor [Mucilaginibacter sp.]|uniref:transcriptional repressor n=1 Tax=Mucilaginibacter sp. TaxID=1882438 RepID=UPI0031B24E60
MESLIFNQVLESTNLNEQLQICFKIQSDFSWSMNYVMTNAFPYRSSHSRPTKQQQHQQLIIEQIVGYLATLREYQDAESLWFDLMKKGSKMSISSFNNRLKKLVESGIVEKISHGYNKHVYRFRHDRDLNK